MVLPVVFVSLCKWEKTLVLLELNFICNNILFLYAVSSVVGMGSEHARDRTQSADKWGQCLLHRYHQPSHHHRWNVRELHTRESRQSLKICHYTECAKDYKVTYPSLKSMCDKALNIILAIWSSKLLKCAFPFF